MNRPDVHVDDEGTYITLTIKNRNRNRPLNISGATVKQFKFQKPSDATFDVTALFVTDGSDGKLEYQWVEGDLDEEGTWNVQAYIEDAAGEWHSDIEEFDVGENITIIP